MSSILGASLSGGWVCPTNVRNAGKAAVSKLCLLPKTQQWQPLHRLRCICFVERAFS